MFKNKVVVITGAGSGIGYLTALNFAKNGAAVILLDYNEKLLEKSKTNILNITDNVSSYKTDIRNYDELLYARKRVLDDYGSIDILINAAGGSAKRIFKCKKEFVDVPIEIFDWGIDVNLKGTFYVDHVMMKPMVEKKQGVIIHIGSITGEEGCPSGIDYSASKSGIMFGLTRSLALYGAQYGIRVCCVSPGPVLTRPEMSQNLTLIGRAGDPQEIVDLILYLSSDKAAYITGINYTIDGGRLIMRGKN